MHNFYTNGRASSIFSIKTIYRTVWQDPLINAPGDFEYMHVCLLIEYPNHLLQIHYPFWKTSYTPGGIKVTHPSEKSLSYLDNEHPGHWIVRRPGLFEGPPRSLDLKSLDCVSLGTIVYCIHRTPMDCWQPESKCKATNVLNLLLTSWEKIICIKNACILPHPVQ